jgi:hypothetical protein
MSHIGAWSLLALSIAVYRMFGTAIPLTEHVAGLYFAALALLMHWLISLISPKESQ